MATLIYFLTFLMTFLNFPWFSCFQKIIGIFCFKTVPIMTSWRRSVLRYSIDPRDSFAVLLLARKVISFIFSVFNFYLNFFFLCRAIRVPPTLPLVFLLNCKFDRCTLEIAIFVKIQIKIFLAKCENSGEKKQCFL